MNVIGNISPQADAEIMTTASANHYCSPQTKKTLRLSFSPSLITLGTAQLGLEYGLANRSGMPTATEAENILTTAHMGGITSFDTARNYGCSEERIGRWLETEKHHEIKIISKLPPINVASSTNVSVLVRKFLNASIAALRTHKIDLLLAHRGSDLLNEEVIKALEQAKIDGCIDNIGASVYDPEEAKCLIRSTPISAIQVPVSILDTRMVNEGVLEYAYRSGVAVFARSVFLQGVVFMKSVDLPHRLKPLHKPITALQHIASDLGLPMNALALNAVRDLHGIESIVLGVERAEQLAPHIANISLPPLPKDVLDQILNVTHTIPHDIVNPLHW